MRQDEPVDSILWREKIDRHMNELWSCTRYELRPKKLARNIWCWMFTSKRCSRCRQIDNTLASSAWFRVLCGVCMRCSGRYSSATYHRERRRGHIEREKLNWKSLFCCYIFRFDSEDEERAMANELWESVFYLFSNFVSVWWVQFEISVPIASPLSFFVRDGSWPAMHGAQNSTANLCYDPKQEQKNSPNNSCTAWTCRWKMKKRYFVIRKMLKLSPCRLTTVRVHVRTKTRNSKIMPTCVKSNP